MTTRKTKKARFFKLTSFKERKDKQRGAFRSALVLSSFNSDQRILDNTPSLRALKELLERPLP